MPLRFIKSIFGSPQSRPDIAMKKAKSTHDQLPAEDILDFEYPPQSRFHRPQDDRIPDNLQ